MSLKLATLQTIFRRLACRVTAGKTGRRERELSRRQAASARTLDDLFAGKTPDEWRAAYSGAYDWGPDVGREVVEDSK